MLHILSNSLMTATRMRSHHARPEDQIMTPAQKARARDARRQEWMRLGGLMP